jgi:hypothetical protein
VVPESSDIGSLDAKRNAIKYEMIVDVLKTAHGNITQAAKQLGLTRRVLGLRMDKHALDRKVFRRIHSSIQEKNMSLSANAQVHAVDCCPAERLVAVATTGKGQIDQHFGHADEFAVYAVGAEGISFIEVRAVEHYCQGGDGDEDKRDIILRTLSDCCALFVARVGDGPRAKLTAAGIKPIDDYPFGAIEESIAAWYRSFIY